MASVPYPASQADVEGLINALYARIDPDQVQQVQKVLQQVQRSPDGWGIAANLLSGKSLDPLGYLKFFGASTITVKLNTDSSSLSDEQATELLHNLVGWFLQAAEESGSGHGSGKDSFVLKKLSSALSTYFIHFSRLWKHCVSHLVQSFDAGRCIPIQDFDSAVPVWQAASSLSSGKLEALVRFAIDLGDMAHVTDPKSAKSAELRTQAFANLKDVAELLFIGMDFSKYGEHTVRLATRCFLSWINFGRSLPEAEETTFGLLRPLLGKFFGLLSNDGEIWETVLFRLVDIVEDYPRFLTDEYHEMVLNVFLSERFQQQYRELVQGDMAHLSVVGIVINYGNARISQLIKSTDKASQLLLSNLAGLTGCKGFIPVEDEIFGQALEFWLNVVEFLADVEEREPWFDTAMMLVNKVMDNCWVKIHWPPIEEFMQWDADTRSEFVGQRNDVADMLEAMFPLRGPAMVSSFIQAFAQSLSLDPSSWGDIEASAFFIASVADCIIDVDGVDDMISEIFSAQFFSKMLQGPTHVPARVRQTTLKLIERYSDYFQRRPGFLPSALNLLFGGLGDAALGGDSAKTIAELCSSCRHVLTGEVPAFLGHFGIIYHQNPLDFLAEERVVFGITSIIQAVSDQGDKLTAFAQLFSFARQDIERSVHLAAHPADLNLEDALHKRGVDPSEMGPTPSPAEVSLHLALRGLRSISGMAKGMRSVSVEPIDIDAQGPTQQISPGLVAIQDDILATLNQVLVTFPTEGEFVEIICNIFRAGFCETELGPFVFHPSTVSSFFTSLTINTPRIGTAVSTACSFLSCLFHGPPEHLVPTLSQLLPWVISLLRALPEPTADTELAQHSIDLIRRLMAKAPGVLFQLQPSSSVESFFLFTLEVLNGNEPLPKAAAAEFWTEILALRSEDPAVQASISGAMQHLGPLVSRSLIRNIGGDAMRSELDKLTEPLKKLVVQQPRAQSWLEAALVAEDFPSNKVSPEDKRMFLKKIIK
ncbi:armadillo-type protein [Coniochaeta sp. 2T2.1]|nr:armadillo-type protein [Coniochaeta sp. 2T2.1]